MAPPEITVLPEQVTAIALVSYRTGAAVGLSQSGSTITIHAKEETIRINAQGHPIEPQEETLC